MFRMVENNIKAFQNGKGFNDSGFRVFMTDRANGALVVRELRHMAAGARRVAG